MSASRIEMPAPSFEASTLSLNVPATARLPSSVEAKRTPSSSAKPVTSIANGSRRPLRCRSATQEIAVTRPSGPSHLPASRTVSKRAEHQAWQARSLAFVTAADISDRIEVRVHSCFTHPGQDQFGRRAMLGCQEDARQMA